MNQKSPTRRKEMMDSKQKKKGEFLFEAGQLKMKSPEYNGMNLTNRVLIEDISIGSIHKIGYYCPAYVRIKIKNFAELSHEDLEATVNVSLILTFNLRGIPMLIQDYIRQKLILQLNRDQAIELCGDEVEVKQDEPSLFTCTVRKMINTSMVANPFYYPFYKIDLILSVTIQSIEIYTEAINDMKQQNQQRIKDLQEEISKIYKEEFEESDPEIKEIKRFEKRQKQDLIKSIQRDLEKLGEIRSINVRFNCMDLVNPKYKSSKISYTDEGTFGDYDLAESLLYVEYSNHLSTRQIWEKYQNKESIDLGNSKDFSKVREFQHTHFVIPLYKYPLVSIVTIFFPLWLLGVLNLGIFAQDTGLADRIASISALMIAFVSLISVIRSEIPPSPKITLIEYLVYAETMTTLFCFIESISVRDTNRAFNWRTNGLFLVSAIITGLQVVIILYQWLLFNCKTIYDYNLDASKQKFFPFDYKKWYNKECDKHFRGKFDNQQLQVLEVSEEEQALKGHEGELNAEDQRHKDEYQLSKEQASTLIKLI